MACGHSEGLAEAKVVVSLTSSMDEATILICWWRQSNVAHQGSTRVSPGVWKGLLKGTGRTGSREEGRAPKTPFFPVLEALLAWYVNRTCSMV